jgi:lipopolysaccharide/colanic/teichoic acid biosynthesis glycosyltransferase
MTHHPFYKRLFDLFFAATGLFLLLPVFAFIALWIKIDSPGPVFFRQTRVGQFGRPFRIYKFRTMVADAEQAGPLVSRGGDPRITRFGLFLRKYKVDELPQLVNIVKGEMSLVGPRPEVPKYVDVFQDEYREILTVKPGITDFASLEFKDENELLKGVRDPENMYIREILPVKIEYCRKYLREQNLLTDLKLILRTIRGIFR